MRVALFSRNAKSADAIGQQVLAKARYFHALGAQVRVYLSEIQGLHPEIAAMGPVHMSARALWRDHGQRAFLRSADLALFEFGAAFDLMDLLPALAGRGPRIIAEYFGLTPLELTEPGQQAEIVAAHQQRGLLWSADVVIVNSTYAGRELQEAIGLPAERIKEVACWVGTSPPLTPAHSPLEGRGEKRTTLLFVGRFARNKQPELIVKALPLLAGLPGPVQAVFVGPQTDVYQSYLAECRELARRLGVAGQLQFLGCVDDSTLESWYQRADVLVLPSLHECFGMPVVEAMARGVPVICSDRGSLPETVGHAGLVHRGENVEDLAGQLTRLLSGDHRIPLTPGPSPRGGEGRVALVTHRFGTNFAGGAEASLRLMAQALQTAGWQVEVFTTCNEHESRWSNTLPSGTRMEDGFLVHRFAIDEYDGEALGRAYHAIRNSPGEIREAETQYLANSLGSRTLIEALVGRRAEFAAIVTGPYLFRLTYEVARRFVGQVLLAPCFHDEPLAYLPAWQAYRNVGGLLFHSEGEAKFTAERLGVCHPRHTVVGTVLADAAFERPIERAPRSHLPSLSTRKAWHPPVAQLYLVYCGRYCPEKGLEQLLACMEKLAQETDKSVKLVCMGQGPLKLPRREWLTDLGYVSEEKKRAVMAEALALVNLSPYESLSIVALEAWALGVPVIASRNSAVLTNQVARSGGGTSINGEEEFCKVVREWREQPELVRAYGKAGNAFVRREYADRKKYGAKLDEIVRSLQRPLREIAVEQGLARARLFSAEAWRERFSQVVVEAIGIQPERAGRHQVDLIVMEDQLECAVGQCSTMMAVRLVNRGQKAVAYQGPARARLIAWVQDGRKKRRTISALTEVLTPHQEMLTTVTLKLPSSPGQYKVCLVLVQRSNKKTMMLAKRSLSLHLSASSALPGQRLRTPVGPLMQSARKTLTQALALMKLPEDYVDVTEGKLAALKKAVKRKLLNNFRKAYVEVGFGQQSALNEKLIAVMSLLLDMLSVGQAGVPAQDAARIAKMERALRRERRYRKLLQRQIDALQGREISSEGKP